MPHRRVNHINPTLEAPSFHGSPNESRALKSLAFKNGEEVRPSPQGDIPLQISNPEYALGSKLTTGRRQNKGYEAELPKTKEFNYPRKNLGPGVFPQSAPMKNGRASNFETYYDPNENPQPVMLDIIDAQRASFIQNEKTEAAVKAREAIPDFDKSPDFIYLQSREDESIQKYFADLSETFNQKRIQKLLAKGFTEDEVAAFLEKERERDIEKAVKNPDDPELLVRAALARHLKSRPVAFTHPTGTNASGIGIRSDVQSIHTVGPAVTTPEMRRKQAREAIRGSELADLVKSGMVNNQGRSDPRDLASAARPRDEDDETFNRRAVAALSRGQSSEPENGRGFPRVSGAKEFIKAKKKGEPFMQKSSEGEKTVFLEEGGKLKGQKVGKKGGAGGKA